jgi:cell wall-associated NlpC family hydrolase
MADQTALQSMMADDPAAPAVGELSADPAQALLALKSTNFGTGEEAPALPSTAPVIPMLLSLSFARAKAFLQACMTSTPRVTYGLGKKVPFLNAVPGRDFTQVDCSGFVREAVREATAPTLAFPDGSVVQHDWVDAQHFQASTIEAAKQDDGMMRIAFLRPQDVPSGIGHVVLIVGGKTLESHGGTGPDSRTWDGSSWQAKTFVYNFARDSTAVG